MLSPEALASGLLHSRYFRKSLAISRKILYNHPENREGPAFALKPHASKSGGGAVRQGLFQSGKAA